MALDMTAVDRAEIGLTPEQRALRRAVREFARAEIAPHVDELERTGRTRATWCARSGGSATSAA